MTKHNQALNLILALSAAGLLACGGGDSTEKIDAGGGGVVSRHDAGSSPDNDSGTDTSDTDGGDTSDAGTEDSGSSSSDGGTGQKNCFDGTPKKMVDFLNRCTKSETTTKKPVIPLANADGTVGPL